VEPIHLDIVSQFPKLDIAEFWEQLTGWVQGISLSCLICHH